MPVDERDELGPFGCTQDANELRLFRLFERRCAGAKRGERVKEVTGRHLASLGPRRLRGGVTALPNLGDEEIREGPKER